VTHPGNPFAPQQPAPAPAPAANPYAQQPAAPAAAPANPFGAGVPQQPAANPYAQPVQQQAPAYPQQAAAPAAQVPQTAPPPLTGTATAAGAPPPTGGKGAKLADMYGRLVLIFPLSITTKPRNPQYITAEQRQRGQLTEEQLTATVVVLDDGQGGMQPIAFGGSLHTFPQVPHTDSEPLPYVRKAMWLSQTKLIEQLRASLPAGPGAAPGMICGRIVKAGPAQNDPWYLQGATEAELGLANSYITMVGNGTFPHPLG
jgi:hypothetical protein